MNATGKYLVKLFDISFGTANNGAPVVSFVFESVEGRERLSYMFALTDTAGQPNNYAIQLTRRWATQWDGRDLTWFRDHREELLGVRTVLTVRGGSIAWASPVSEAARPGQGEQGHAGCVPPPADQPQAQSAKKTIDVKLVVDQSKAEQMPKEIEPAFESAKALFDLVTEGTYKLDADKVWTLLAKKIGPMQIDFGREEWQRMIDLIRQLKNGQTTLTV